MPRMQIHEPGARSAAQILVAAANREIDVERADVDRQHAERMIDVEQHARAAGVRRTDKRRQPRQHLAGVEQHLGYDDQIDVADGREKLGGFEHSVGARPRRTAARCACEARIASGSDRSNRIRRALPPRAADGHSCSGWRAAPAPRWSSARRSRRVARASARRAAPDRRRSPPATRPTRCPAATARARRLRRHRPPSRRAAGPANDWRDRPADRGAARARTAARRGARCLPRSADRGPSPRSPPQWWPRYRRAGSCGPPMLAAGLARAAAALPPEGEIRGLGRPAGAHGAPITVRTSISSGKNVCSSTRRKNATPLDPPVPAL